MRDDDIDEADTGAVLNAIQTAAYLGCFIGMIIVGVGITGYCTAREKIVAARRRS